VDGLLAGVRVLDLSVWRPGPYATQLLAELGADVLKVEPPGGDPMRGYPELFASLHANKRSIVLDLKSDRDRARVLELAVDTDVVVEGFRPGVAARLGVAYDDVLAVNESVIYASISGMGQTGPLADASGHDLNYMAWSGALSPEGGPAAVPAVPVADLASGLAAAFGICAAVVRRLQTGEGEHLDIAMTDVLATWTGSATPRATGVEPGARGVPGYGCFATSDGRQLTLGIVTEDHFWRALCDVLALDDVAEVGFVARVPRVDELQERISAAIGTRPRDEVLADLLARGVPAAPVLDRAEMLALPHLRERGVVGADPWADPATGHPIVFARSPAARTAPPPALDEHHGEGFHPR
jgi:crotonobetainyl-CoA:carnitine CoA-transferase CaiB-like acyl-CoA transferase